MKNVALPILMTALLSLSAGCGGGESEPSAPPAGGGEAVGDEADLRSPSLTGTYEAATADDDQHYGKVRVVQQGPKLTIELDSATYDLGKTKSGAYVFTSGDLDGECDDPGCSYVTKVSGVVYLKKVGNAKKPTVKLTVRENHPYPEYDGDIDGETTTTLRWNKKR